MSTKFDDFHCSGRAVDILISGADALRLVEVARKYSMTGIGVKAEWSGGKTLYSL